MKSTCGGTRLEFKIENFFIENLTRRKKIISKSDALYFFNQNLTGCIFLNSKSDVLYLFQFKI